MVKQPFNESIHKDHVANDKLPHLHEVIANRLVCHDMSSISNELSPGVRDTRYQIEEAYERYSWALNYLDQERWDDNVS